MSIFTDYTILKFIKIQLIFLAFPMVHRFPTHVEIATIWDPLLTLESRINDRLLQEVLLLSFIFFFLFLSIYNVVGTNLGNSKDNSTELNILATPQLKAIL
jgi:hypothetical protein